METEESQVITVDLSKNPKQWDYFLEIIKSCNGKSNKRKFAYGGAIRGGKTYVTLFIIVYLCNRYPGSKWAVIRDAMPTLQKTTVESLKKILNNSEDWDWNLDKGNFFCQNKKGSRIYFMAENIAADPDLTKFLGLEVNGVFFEQLEELQKKTWDIVISRVGSWYLESMPPAFVFTTFNPTQTWVKADIYEKWVSGDLPPDFHFQIAKHDDNAFVTEDQRETWAAMDERWRRQLVEGEWIDFDDKDPRWLYSFDRSKHVKDVPFLPSFPVYLSFDFNNTPFEATAWQYSTDMGSPNSFAHCIAEFSGSYKIPEMCMRIRSKFPNSILYVTGDRSGQNEDVGRNQTNYQMIASHLNLNSRQLNLNSANLEHADSRTLMNSLFAHYPHIYIHPDCVNTIMQSEAARVDNTKATPHQLLKDRNKGLKMDAFDSVRYFFQTYFLEYAKKKYFRFFN